MKTALPALSEHQIQSAIIDLLRYENYYVWRNNVGAAPYISSKTGKKQWVRFGQPGFSDIFAIQPGTGKFIALEVKTPKTRNNATRFQLDFIRQIQEKGGIAAVVCSTEEVVALLGIKALL